MRNLSFLFCVHTLSKNVCFGLLLSQKLTIVSVPRKKANKKHKTENFAGLHNHSLVNYQLGHGAMVNGLCARLRGIERSRSKPCRGLCDVFLCKTLIFHSYFLHQGVQMGTDSLLGLNLNEDVNVIFIYLRKKE